MSNDLRLRVILGAMENITAPLNRIVGGASAAGREMKALRDKVKQLNAAQREVGQFRELSQGLTKTRGDLDQARAKVRDLAAALRETAEPSRGMQRDFDNAVRAAGRLKAAEAEQRAELQRLRDGLATAGVSTANLARDEIRLRENISQTNRQITDQASRLKRLGAAHAAFDKAKGAAGRMAMTGAAAVGAGYAVTRPLNAIVQAFAPAEDAAMQLQVSMMGKGAEVSDQYEKIKRLATELGDLLPGTTADFQNMMTMLKRQGMSDQAILGGLGEATAYAGVLLKMPFDGAAEFSAKMQDATRTTEGDMMGLMDAIQRGFYAGVDPDNMLNAYSKIAPALSLIKKEGLEAVQMLNPLVAMMDQAGMAGEASGNAIRKVFQAVLSEKKLGKANDLLGPKQQLDFSDGKGEFGGLDQLFEQLDKLKDLNSMQRMSVLKELFGDDAETLQVVNTIMSKGMAGYKEMQGKLDSQASLQERVKAQLTTLQNVADAAGGSFTNALADMGTAMAPDMKAVLTYLGGIASRVGAWARENPGLVQTLGRVTAVIATLLIAFGGLMLVVSTVLLPLAGLKFAMAYLGIAGGGLGGVLMGLAKGALPFLLGAVRAITMALVANPIGLAVTAIGTAALLIYQYWDPIKAFFVGLWGQVRTAFDGGIAGIGALLVNWSPVGLIYSAFASVMSYLGVDLPAKFTEAGAAVLQGFASGITNSLGLVKDSITGAADSTMSWFKEKLGIHSPSRVFIGYGGNISEGAAIGIEQAQPEAIRATKALATALVAGGMLSTAAGPGTLPGAGEPLRFDTRPPLAAAAAARPATVVAGDTITIHINVTGGADPQAIAAAVRQQLEQRDSDRAARGRSSMYDKGD